jgi:ABC-2 type transport system permease protein
MIMRGVYSFEPKIRTGAFDFTLTKPLNPLFQALIGSPDFNDVLAAIPLFGFSFWYLIGHGYFAEMGTSLLFLLYLANGMLIAAAFHIFVLCVGIAFLEVDNAVWMYRDIIQMGRFPIDIYREPMRWIVTFIVPTGIMISYPARELIGKASNFAWIGLVVGVVLFVLSLLTWKRALKAYSSASS